MSLAPQKTYWIPDQDQRKIAEIGMDRRPAEACGILLQPGHEHKGERVFEMPNRAMGPNDEFVMNGDDILLVLEGYSGELEKLTIWHTHPGGQIGPSSLDLAERPGEFGYLVVALFAEAREAVFTWY